MSAAWHNILNAFATGTHAGESIDADTNPPEIANAPILLIADRNQPSREPVAHLSMIILLNDHTFLFYVILFPT
ncbi:hypothetical protein CJP72_24885 [Citrobacter sp. NCU1]|nr:hypothetical protein [Citrobacter sp. NCU1]